MSRPHLLPCNLPIGTALVVAALLVSLCAPAEAGRAKRRPSAKTGAPAATQPAAAPAVAAAPATAGMVAAINPATGRLGRPTAAQMLKLSAAEHAGLLHTSEGLTEVQLPDGSWMSDLQGRFHMYSAVGLDGFGWCRFSCVDGEPALLRALAPAAPAPALVER